MRSRGSCKQLYLGLFCTQPHACRNLCTVILTVYIVHMGICLMSDLFFFFLHMLMNIKSISHCVFCLHLKHKMCFSLWVVFILVNLAFIFRKKFHPPR